MGNTLQKSFTHSIHPTSLSHLRKSSVFLEFMRCFHEDCRAFMATRSEIDSLLKHFKTIYQELDSRNLLSNFLVRLNLHSKLRDYKTSAVAEYRLALYDGFDKRIRAIHDCLLRDLGREIALPIDKSNLERLPSEDKQLILRAEEDLQLAFIQFVGLISGLVSTMFFAFESSCKMSCSLGCFSFAVLFARDEIIQHRTIWKTLRRLGETGKTTETRCITCLMNKDCNFEIDYEALANIYCYAIKIRMLTDYELFFYENPSIWSQIEEYFKKLREIIDSQKEIETKCLEVRLS